MFNIIKRYYNQKRSIKELNKLSNRELYDIGITRNSIRDAVKGTL